MAVTSAPTRTQPLRRALGRLDPSMLLPLGIVVVIGYLTLVPVGMMVLDSFRVADGSLTAENYTTILTSGSAYRLLLTSVIFAVGSAIVATVIGAILAWFVERTNLPFRRLIFAAALVPLIIPGALSTFAWVLILSPRVGVVNVALQKMFGFEDGPFNVFSMPGMILVEGVHLSTLAFLMMAGALRSVDASLEEAAATSGAGILTAARRITMPLMLPALASTLLIGFIRAIESFEVPAMLGLQARQYVLASQIYLALKTFPINYGVAGAYSTMLFVVGAVGVLLYLRMIARGRFATVTGKGYRPRQIDLRGWRWPAFGFALVYVIFLFALPALLMLWASFLPYYMAPGLEGLSVFTLDNYREILSSPTITRAATNSLVLAVSSATIVVVLAAVSAWVTVRTKIRGRQLVDVIAFVPIAIPGIVLGVALVELYAAFPFPIYGTLLVLVIAYVIKFLPYGMRAGTTTITQVSKELEEVAAVSGANWFQSFYRVLLPLLRPGLFAAWVYVFIVASRELSSSIILSSSQNMPLAVLIYSLYTNGNYTGLSALGVLMIVVLTLLVLFFQKLGGKPGQQTF